MERDLHRATARDADLLCPHRGDAEPDPRDGFDVHLFEDLFERFLKRVAAFAERDARHDAFDPVAESTDVVETNFWHLNSGIFGLDDFEPGFF